MADMISQIGGAKQTDSTAQRTAKAKQGEGAAVKAQQPVSSPNTGADEVVLSEISQKAANEPGFDPQKVEAIKQAISDGNYPLDARRIAESFSSLERLIGDTANS